MATALREKSTLISALLSPTVIVLDSGLKPRKRAVTVCHRRALSRCAVSLERVSFSGSRLDYASVGGARGRLGAPSFSHSGQSGRRRTTWRGLAGGGSGDG